MNRVDAVAGVGVAWAMVEVTVAELAVDVACDAEGFVG